MINRILLAALAAAIFLGAGAYTLGLLNERSLRLAEVTTDVCYSRHGIGLVAAPSVPEAIRRECAQPMRDYASAQPWRYVFAAATGATAALLVVGGIVILVRRRRRQPAVPLGR